MQSHRQISAPSALAHTVQNMQRGDSCIAERQRVSLPGSPGSACFQSVLSCLHSKRGESRTLSRRSPDEPCFLLPSFNSVLDTTS